MADIYGQLVSAQLENLVSDPAGVPTGRIYYDTALNLVKYYNVGTAAWVSLLTNPMSATGDMVYGGASGVLTRLAAGTADYALTGAGASAPVWKKLVNANIDAAAAIEGSKLVAATGTTAGALTGIAQTVSGLKTWTNGIVVPATAATGNVCSGTYTPTLTNVTGTNAHATNVTQWFRVGDMVTVFGNLTIGTTGAPAQATLTLPIAPSNFTQTYQAGGSTQQAGSFGYRIFATVSAATVTLDSTGAPGGGVHSFIFSYRVS